MNKKIVLLVTFVVLLPSGIGCFGRRRKKKNLYNGQAIQFISPDQKSLISMGALPPAAKFSSCASCSQCGSRNRKSPQVCSEEMVTQNIASMSESKQVQKKIVKQNLSIAEPLVTSTSKPEQVPISTQEPKKVEAPTSNSISKTSSMNDDKPAVEGELRELATAADLESFINDNTAVVIEAYTNSCGVCKTIIPFLKKLAGEYDGKILFAKINAETSAADKLKKIEKIESVPRFYYYKNGTLVHKTRGGCGRKIMEINLKTAFPDISK